MRIRLLQYNTAEILSKQLLEIGEGKITPDEANESAFPPNFCNILPTIYELIGKHHCRLQKPKLVM